MTYIAFYSHISYSQTKLCCYHSKLSFHVLYHSSYVYLILNWLRQSRRERFYGVVPKVAQLDGLRPVEWPKGAGVEAVAVDVGL